MLVAVAVAKMALTLVELVVAVSVEQEELLGLHLLLQR
jgi:hypothetical protein